MLLLPWIVLMLVISIIPKNIPFRTRCSDDNIQNRVAVDVNNVQGVSEAGGEATTLTIPRSCHLNNDLGIICTSFKSSLILTIHQDTYLLNVPSWQPLSIGIEETLKETSFMIMFHLICKERHTRTTKTQP